MSDHKKFVLYNIPPKQRKPCCSSVTGRGECSGFAQVQIPCCTKLLILFLRDLYIQGPLFLHISQKGPLHFVSLLKSPLTCSQGIKINGTLNFFYF